MDYVTVYKRLCDLLHPEKMSPGNGHTVVGLYALLVLTKGEDVTLEDAHEAWVMWKVLEDWTYAPVKDNAAKKTPYLVPFPELDPVIAAYDQVYVDAMRQVARESKAASQS